MEDILPILLVIAVFLSMLFTSGENCHSQVAEVVCKTCELSNWTGSVWAEGVVNCSDIKENCEEVVK